MTDQNVKINYLNHIVLTIKSIAKTKNFYSKVLGKPKYSDKYQIMYQFGKTKLFLATPYRKIQKSDKFDPNRIGLEHLAFGVASLGDLARIEKKLNKEKVKNSGIHTDKHSKKEKIWLNDPDSIRLEFFL